MTPDEYMSLNGPQRDATIVAVLVRNGLEDLHAEGAFDDSQAPTLNRLVRQEAYQAMLAAELSGDEANHQLLMFLADLAEAGHPDAGHDMHLLCMTGAVARALATFAESEGIDEDAWEQLTEAAQLAVLDHEEYDGLTKTEFGIRLLLSCITEWEAPELGPEFRALLPVERLG